MCNPDGTTPARCIKVDDWYIRVPESEEKVLAWLDAASDDIPEEEEAARMYVAYVGGMLLRAIRYGEGIVTL